MVRMAVAAHFGVPTDEEAGLKRGVVTGGGFRVSVMTAALGGLVLPRFVHVALARRDEGRTCGG